MAQRKKRGIESIYTVTTVASALTHDIMLMHLSNVFIILCSPSLLLDLLAKTFYAWIQVRNIAAVEKVNSLEKARAYSQKKLKKKVFEAWLFLRVRRVCHFMVSRVRSCRLGQFINNLHLLLSSSNPLCRLGHTCQ